MERVNRDPFGHLMPPAKPEPEITGLTNRFKLSESVGVTAPNHRRDVAKVETLMDRAGYLDLRQTDGATGYYGERLKQAVEGFQKDNGLKKDGLLNPRGETVQMLMSILRGAAFDRGEGRLPQRVTPREKSPPLIPWRTLDQINIPRDNVPGTRDRNVIDPYERRPKGKWI